MTCESHYISCFAHAVNLAVGVFISGLSPKRGPQLGVDKNKPLILGSLPSRRCDESDVMAVEDDNDEIEALQHELNEVERSSAEVSSTVNASTLLLQIQSFVAKVCLAPYIHFNILLFTT